MKADGAREVLRNALERAIGGPSITYNVTRVLDALDDYIDAKMAEAGRLD